jgi:hypothetical protein
MAGKSNKSKWISGAIKHTGAFEKKAKRANMTVKAFTKKVLSKNSKASATPKKKAQLAKTLLKLRKNK